MSQVSIGNLSLRHRAEFPAPPPNEMVSFWEDMQWQCSIVQKFYGGFEEMPWHFQNWSLLERSFSFDEIMIHEGLHRAWKKSDWAWWQWIPFTEGRDLRGFDEYKTSIKGY
ncbi:MAG: hypothetical protein KIS76_01860 [Pyrinomonadaceae bacterium]|nr:hypothetical protein [Pyrinomonadaceae bacterium]